MWDRIKVARYVAFYDPLVAFSCCSYKSVSQVGHCVICVSVWPESIGMDTEIGFPYGFQDHAECFLYNSVAYTRYAQWSFPSIWFWDIHSPYRLRFKAFGLE